MTPSARLRRLAAHSGQDAYNAELLAIADELERASAQGEGWISVDERLPDPDEAVLVWSKYPWEKTPSAKIDRWSMQREAPVSFSSATVDVGYGWDEHENFESVTHWKRIAPPIPATSPAKDQA